MAKHVTASGPHEDAYAWTCLTCEDGETGITTETEAHERAVTHRKES